MSRLFSPETLVHFDSGDLEQGLEVALRLVREARHGVIDQHALLQHLRDVCEFAIRLEAVAIAIDARQEMLARNRVLAENGTNQAIVEDLSRLGFYYSMAKEWKQAVKYLHLGIDAAQQLEPEERTELPQLWVNRCHVAWNQDDLSLALQYLLESYRAHIRFTRDSWFDNFSFHSNYAFLLKEMGECSKAAKACRLALQIGDRPDVPPHQYLRVADLQFLQGSIYLHNKDFGKALSAFERSQELLQLAPRRNPPSERRAAEKYAAAIAKVRAELERP